ncbi:MAG: transglutaminase-like domain-containing protein [Rhodovibrionaceae bacterium]|nr:transglutaminase-like domain-containing protein [Rhodovibrionaceae bacterium]
MGITETALSQSGIRRSSRADMVAWLRRIGGQPDEEIDLAAGALALAGLARPGADLMRYEHHLSLLARDVADLGARAAAGEDLNARAETLSQVIAGRYGYSGDEETYDDLENADLMRVIDRRMGLPVALGILFIHAGRAQGWHIEGLNFPGHFLLRLELDGARAILDPFHGGAIRQTADLRALLKTLAGNEAELQPEHYEPLGNRDVLLRLQNNLKLRLMRRQQPAEAVEVVETMLMFAPAHAQLWREAGLIHAHLENLRAAALALENYLELAEAGDSRRHEAAELLSNLRKRLN